MVAVGSLIDGHEVCRWISTGIAKVDRPIDFCSAFLRSEALTGLLKTAPKSLTGRILVRWRLGDFLTGASDFAAFDIALSHGLRVYMRLDFHGKVFSLPPLGIVVGSANATFSGLGMTMNANAEVCTLVGYSETNQEVIEGLFRSAIEVDRQLLISLQTIVSNASPEPPCNDEWPESITNRLVKLKQGNRLLFESCFWSAPNWLNSSSTENFHQNQLHDMRLLGFETDLGMISQCKEQVKYCVRRTAIVQWLVTALNENDGEAYFGYLASQLHSALSDAPHLTREDAKLILQNLLEWVSVVEIGDVAIDRPNHSQRVRLVRN